MRAVLDLGFRGDREGGVANDFMISSRNGNLRYSFLRVYFAFFLRRELGEREREM